MRIKSLQILLALPLLGAALTSCKLDDNKFETLTSATVSQIVIPDDEDTPVSCQSNCMYSFKFDMGASTFVTTATDIKAGSASGSFQTDAAKFNYSFISGYDVYRFSNVEGTLGNAPLTGMTGYMAAPANVLDPAVLVMQYRIDGATVKTFNPAPVFSGKTVTSYPAGPAGNKTAESEDATYGVIFSSDMKQAIIVIRNIKFAPEMPRALELVQIKGLAVTFDRGGYTITGSNIIPEVLEGDGMTQYKNFPFNSIELHTSNATLTEVECTYEVAATIGERSMIFNGAFTGKSDCTRPHTGSHVMPR